jgi:glucosamine-6-phosphate deaminase
MARATSVLSVPSVDSPKDIKAMITSKVEQDYMARSGYSVQTGRIPYVIVDNFPELGMLTARRFLEWVAENPEGVVSLPTGKTPEYFIKYTQELLAGHAVIPAKAGIPGHEEGDPGFRRDDSGFRGDDKCLRGLRFVQIDDFYPISPRQHNSFYHYVNEFYIKGLGLDPKRALLINSDEIPVLGRYQDVFPNLTIDLTLRHREPASHLEELQQKSIFLIDSWCMEYEQRIREMGGIGFFLGGIGPDGHIAFNIKGSDHHSTTRLSPTNYATQAAAAGDLGGIEVSGSRHVITIGLGTITMNPDAVAIIFAAGESKATIIKAAIENEPDVQSPASVLQKLPNARFYLTQGAAKELADVQNRYFSTGEWTVEKSIRSVLRYCQENNVFAHKIGEEGHKGMGAWGHREEGHGEPRVTRHVSRVTDIPLVIEEVKSRLDRGIAKAENKVILHTGPHHDDIMLGLMPLVNRQLRSGGNQVHFAVATSGFTALSNRYLIERLEHTLRLIDRGEIQMLRYPDFFGSGYLFKWDKDVNHYLNKVGSRDEEGKFRGLSHRIVRCMVKIWQLTSAEQLRRTIIEVIRLMNGSYDGEKNPPEIQQLKGMIREFEEELVWAHSGIQVKDVHHLRLGFYKGDIFTEQPEEERDVKPILDLLNEINPDIISVTMDPEGSGPDTHYKVLQAIAKAIRRWTAEEGPQTADGRPQKEDGRPQTAVRGPRSAVKVVAYRNVWYRFHAAEANVYVPVSLNSLAVLQNSFRQCYLSQLDASFPSPELKGPFCDLAQKVWTDQFKEIQLLLGKDFFYENERPLIRATHGLVFYRELSVEQFLEEAEELARKMA